MAVAYGRGSGQSPSGCPSQAFAWGGGGGQGGFLARSFVLDYGWLWVRVASIVRGSIAKMVVLSRLSNPL